MIHSLLLGASVLLLAGCGTASAGVQARGRSPERPAYSRASLHRAGRPVVMVRRAALPGGGRVTIVAASCVQSTAPFAGCYELGHRFEEANGRAVGASYPYLTMLRGNPPIRFGRGHEWGDGDPIVVGWGCVGRDRLVFVYGVTGDPAGAAVAHTVAGRAIRLRSARIPTTMEPRGAVVYGAFKQESFSLTMRDAHGMAKVWSYPQIMASSDLPSDGRCGHKQG